MSCDLGFRLKHWSAESMKKLTTQFLRKVNKKCDVSSDYDLFLQLSPQLTYAENIWKAFSNGPKEITVAINFS